MLHVHGFGWPYLKNKIQLLELKKKPLSTNINGLDYKVR